MMSCPRKTWKSRPEPYCAAPTRPPPVALLPFRAWRRPRTGRFRFYLTELSPDGQRFKLYTSQIFPEDGLTVPEEIAQELLEAAEVDGSTGWQRFRYIMLPLLRPALLPATILSAITTFQMFNTVYLITAGGPFTSGNINNPGATEFLMVYMYDRVRGREAEKPAPQRPWELTGSH